MATPALDVADLVRQHFPDDLYYTQVIGADELFHGTPFAKLLPELASASELAQCLAFMPHAFVLFRGLPPERGAFFVSFFAAPIKLDAAVAQTYERYFPPAILLYAPAVPEHIWLADYFAGKPATRMLFEMRA